jgi:predicted helicase
LITASHDLSAPPSTLRTMKPESIVEKTLADLLAEFRATATSDSDKGTKFERLTKFYLIKDPIWSEQLANVRLREEAGIGPDVGIDLVADDIATGGKVAIQCKFYDEKTYLDDLGTFYTSSGKDGYVKRIVVTTSNQWTRNAEEALKNQQIPVQRILLHDMEQSLISWGAFNLTENYGSVPIAQKELRPHQLDALTAVMDGFKEADRGKVIMACGTGKTLVSLRITEEFFKKKKTPSTILFLAPSISLLSQTIMEWGQNKKSYYMALAVCSDAKVGKKDDDDMQVNDLAIPASTDVEKLAAALANRGSKNLVIFSTYQSLEIISKAQNDKKNLLSEFDLVVCDEAHRTTGVTTAAKAAAEDFSHFVRIHDNSYVKASKRLYMTATPKIYKDIDNKVTESGGVIASMDDPENFGEEFYRLGFGTAVERGLLSDYRVLILAVDEEYVARVDLERFRLEDSTINLDDASKLLGCWRGLSKIKTLGEDADNIPMKRAVAFANTIDASQVLAKRLEIVGRTANRPTEGNQGLTLQTKHVDGKQNALVRRQSLEWLKSEPGLNTARILTNARCLSEGIDVPALDAVIFTEARGSQVDIVQAVGRVMRKYDGKNSGYIILPVAITAGADINATLKGTKYKVIWDVLNALRAHDDRFDVIVNQINLNQDRDKKIEVNVITGDDENSTTAQDFEQGILVHLPTQIADGIYAKIVEKVGERNYWEKWAKDVAEIAQRSIVRITALVENGDTSTQKEFSKFLKGLQDNLNSSISKIEAIEMLAQHMITKPIFEALFVNYNFTELNPVSKVMQGMMKKLSNSNLDSETESLDLFYESVRNRAAGINTQEGRQHLVKELYEKFFKFAFSDTAERLGIVYTPLEVVDFIIHSTQWALKKSFKQELMDSNVHILDPFTGTGTFIVRLLQSGLIPTEKLAQKFSKELHANELVLLAYYVAAINIEETFHSLTGEYAPFSGIVLTDTFQMTEGKDSLDLGGVFPDNNQRVKDQNRLDIKVILGNPPYAVGNMDGNSIEESYRYDDLDSSIDTTYAKLSSVSLKKSLYDSYFRAFRWSSDRIGESGIICFVTNGSWLDSKTADGFRKSLLSEFTEIHVFNLRGNARTSGEIRRKERGNVFGEGSRTPVAITLLIKNPNASKNEKVNYHDIGDYLSQGEKLEKIRDFGSFEKIPLNPIVPDSHGDWLNQRRADFQEFIAMGDKNNKTPSSNAIFCTFSNGVKTNRDAWAYNFNSAALSKNMNEMIDFYNLQIGKSEISTNDHQISWDQTLLADLKKLRKAFFEKSNIRRATYRPFIDTNLYFSRMFNNSVYQIPKYFPEPESQNLIISINQMSTKNFDAFMTKSIPDVQLSGNGQCFPLYIYSDVEEENSLFTGPTEVDRKTSGISKHALKEFRSRYGSNVSEEDVFFYVYGILWHGDYLRKYESNLRKEMPRIPFSGDFQNISTAGRQLGELHVNHMTCAEYPLELIDTSMGDHSTLRVSKLRWDFKGKSPVLQIADGLALTGFPTNYQDFTVNGRSPIDWAIDRYQVKTDSSSEIINDPNEELLQHGGVISILKRLTFVSSESLRIIENMPPIIVIK